MRKYYVLDTNILLHDPNSLTSFEDNIVLIPIEVIAEIDRFKKEQTERGQNARRVTRILDSLRTIRSLSEGVPINRSGLLRIICERDPSLEAAHSNGYAPHDSELSADSALLRVARSLANEHPDAAVVLVTKDINLRIRADAMGLRAEDFQTDRVNPDDLYSGQLDLQVPVESLDRFEQLGSLEAPLQAGSQLLPNEYVLLRAVDSPRSLLGRVSADMSEVVALAVPQRGASGVRPRNKEQFFALDALLNDEIKLVTIMGKAGTGKTMLAMAAGLEKTLVAKRYKSVLVSRPTVPMGRDVGYLPGTIDEKLSPWMKPIADTLDFLITNQTGGRHVDARRIYDEGVVQIEGLTYIRGRSINNHYVIIDEAQNLTPLEVKTVITRVGHDTKIVFTGDPYQIDNPYVDSSSNGFNYLVNRFRAERLAAHVELRKGERSDLAELAANLL